MKNIKEGSIIKFIADDNVPPSEIPYTREVLGVCGKIVFTRDINTDGSFSPSSFYEIKDLETMGWTVVE